MTINWPCDACDRSPTDVDELLRWPVLSEGGTLCPQCAGLTALCPDCARSTTTDRKDDDQ